MGNQATVLAKVRGLFDSFKTNMASNGWEQSVADHSGPPKTHTLCKIGLDESVSFGGGRIQTFTRLVKVRVERDHRKLSLAASLSSLATRIMKVD
jgi:hypothetical protein